MALVTMAAFLLAVRFDAMVVAILGMLGGFLTPILVSTGQDNPLGLFGYIAILDAGLILVALRRRWFFLTALAALGTAILQILWAGEFFVAGKYAEGNKILVALAVLLGFNALFVAATWLAKMRKPAAVKKPASVHLTGIPANNLALRLNARPGRCGAGFQRVVLGFPAAGATSGLMFGFVFLMDLAVVALVLADETIAAAQSIAGFAVFGLLAIWTQNWLSN